MYTPKFNQVSDRVVLLEAMRRYSFATLFGPAGELRATHLPLLVKDEGEHGTVLGHFARANMHWAALAGREAMVVFPGPHTFVSPALYTEPLSVPTWNYIAIHAYGTLDLIEDPGRKNELVEQLVRVHDPAFLERWHSMADNYRTRMLNGIVGFQMPILRIEARFKLGQNRNAEERRNMHAAQKSGSDDERELAGWMERLIGD